MSISDVDWLSVDAVQAYCPLSWRMKAARLRENDPFNTRSARAMLGWAQSPVI